MLKAWWEQEDKYNFFFSFLLILFFLVNYYYYYFYSTYFLSFCCCCCFFGSLCDVKLERRPQTSLFLVFVHWQSACFGRALLWHRCCKNKKEERKPRNKATDATSVWFFFFFFFLVFVFFSVLRKSFSLEGILLAFPKVSNKYPRPPKKTTKNQKTF